MPMILKVKRTTEVTVQIPDSKATVYLNSENENAIREALEKLISRMTPSQTEENGKSRSSDAEP